MPTPATQETLPRFAPLVRLHWSVRQAPVGWFWYLRAGSVVRYAGWRPTREAAKRAARRRRYRHEADLP